MNNAEIAAVFLEMGELLQIQGGDPYRARAFKRTAQIIENIREPIAERMKHADLERIPGIGPGSVERIKSILRSGTCVDHQKLLARLPQGLRDVVKVRGMGPRHARLAFERLGVKNLDDLALVARNGALLLVPGIGTKTVERVLAHLEDMARGPAPRIRLDQALDLGQKLLDHMREEPACLMLAQTGSARRMKETVGDLDILVATRQAGPVVQRFVTFPQVKEIILAGDSRATVILSNGVQADLRIVTADTFGAGLHYFTGNKQHNIQLRMRANNRKLQLSEHGVWERKLFGRGQGEDNRKIARRIVAGRTEEEIFHSLGVPYIAPELREGDGEIEAAAEGKLPRIVELGDLQGDLHLRPGNLADASAMLHAAKTAGLAYVAIVVDAGAPVAFSWDEIALVEKSVGVRALKGVRVCIDAAGSAFTDAAGSPVDVDALRAAFDLVYAHVVHEREMPAAAMTARVVKAVTSGKIDALHHPTGRTLLDESAPPDLDIEIWTVLKAAARSHVLVEAGGDPAHLDVDARGIRTNVEVGASISVASEARTPEEMRHIAFSLGQARRGWMPKEFIGNTMTLEQLEAWLGERRVSSSTQTAARRTLLGGWLAADPLADELARVPLDAAVVARLERFLHGESDPPLERALARASGNALQRAFELIAQARG